MKDNNKDNPTRKFGRAADAGEVDEHESHLGADGSANPVLPVIVVQASADDKPESDNSENAYGPEIGAW